MDHTRKLSILERMVIDLLDVLSVADLLPDRNFIEPAFLEGSVSLMWPKNGAADVAQNLAPLGGSSGSFGVILGWPWGPHLGSFWLPKKAGSL